jgi:hypothetical protein
MLKGFRRMAAVAGVATLAAVLGGGSVASAAQKSSLRGTFSVQFPKGHPASNAPCPTDAFCGVGSLAGYGQATITILDETFDEIPDSDCFAVTRVEEVDLLNGNGSLVISSTGTFCRPGHAGDSHASDSSYGGPGRFAFSFAVDGTESTGAFAGMTGGGVETMNVNGGIGVWHLAGSVTS